MVRSPSSSASSASSRLKVGLAVVAGVGVVGKIGQLVTHGGRAYGHHPPVDESSVPSPLMHQPNAEVSTPRDTCERSRFGTFSECPHCAGTMQPEHAHFRCGGAAGAIPAATDRGDGRGDATPPPPHLAVVRPNPVSRRTVPTGEQPCSSRIRRFATGGEEMAVCGDSRWHCGGPRRAGVDSRQVAPSPRRRVAYATACRLLAGRSVLRGGSVRSTPTSFSSDGGAAFRGSRSWFSRRVRVSRVRVSRLRSAGRDGPGERDWRT